MIDRSTFENITKWLKFIRDIENCLLVICGNKLDLSESRLVISKYLGKLSMKKEKN